MASVGCYMLLLTGGLYSECPHLLDALAGNPPDQVVGDFAVLFCGSSMLPCSQTRCATELLTKATSMANMDDPLNTDFLGSREAKKNENISAEADAQAPTYSHEFICFAFASHICIHVCFMRYITFTFWTGFVGSVKESQVVISCSFVPHGPMCWWCHLLGTVFTKSNLITHYYHHIVQRYTVI